MGESNAQAPRKKRLKTDQVSDPVLASPALGNLSDSTNAGRILLSDAGTTTSPLPGPRSKLGFSIKSFIEYGKEPYNNSAFVSSLSISADVRRLIWMNIFNKYKAKWVEQACGLASLPKEDNKPTESFGNVLLAHAQMYVLGDRYMIRRLKVLALAKLCVALYAYVIYPERIDELADLVRYIFANTMARCGLQVAVEFYAAGLWCDLGGYAAWKELIDEGGDFLQAMARLIPDVNLCCRVGRN